MKCENLLYSVFHSNTYRQQIAARPCQNHTKKPNNIVKHIPNQTSSLAQRQSLQNTVSMSYSSTKNIKANRASRQMRRNAGPKPNLTRMMSEATRDDGDYDSDDVIINTSSETIAFPFLLFFFITSH